MIEQDQIWMVVVGFIIAFVLAFGIGANDVANSFGTSVGAKVLTLKQACILASVFEILGALLIGARVSDTIRKGIIDVEPYENNTQLLMVGNVAALSGSCVWLFAATLLRLPVSATHSIVGATVGFALVAHGARGINWMKLGMIIGSWFVSPVLAGLFSMFVFFLCKKLILNKEDPLEPGLKFLPIFYALTLIINFFSIFYDGPEMLGFDKIPLWGTFILSFGSGLICALVVQFGVVPWLRKRIVADNYKGPQCEEVQEDQVKYGFEGDDASKLAVSANISLNGSKNGSSSPCPSLDTSDKLLVEQSAIEMESAPPCTEKDGAANLLAPPIVVSEATPEKKSNLKNKIDKNEDAPLMDNEYKQGNTTPLKSPTVEDLNKINNKDYFPREEYFRQDSVKTKALMDPEASPGATTVSSEDVDLAVGNIQRGRSAINDRPETSQLFSFLQILTAIFGAFAHGGNDVSNAIGPLVSLWLIGSTGLVKEKAPTPIWILLYGGVGISLGLCILGRRVIKTIGEDLTRVTPSSGFCIEIGSAFTVLVSSNLGIPISTTHCKVGSVVFVGRFRSRENVDWSVFRNIILAWLVTLPVTGGIAAAMMAGLQLTVPH